MYIEDPQGKPILDRHRKPKPHPAVVLTATHEILQGLPITIAAISTKFNPKRLKSGEFRIAHNVGGDV